MNWLYNRIGQAEILQYKDMLIDRNGNFLALISNNNIFSSNGQHIGWYEGGVLYDKNNLVLGFTINHTNSLPSTPGIGGTPICVPAFVPAFRPCWLSGIPGRPGYGGWSQQTIIEYFASVK